MDATAFWLTLKLACCSTAILCVIGLPLAWWLARPPRSVKFLIEALVTLPLVLPPTVLGYYLLVFFAPTSPLGTVLEATTGFRLPFTFPGILLATLIFNTPFAIRAFVVAFARIDQRLLEASWCLGVSRWATFWRIAIPLAWPGILTGIVLAFAHTLGEFGVILMVGGSIPGVTRTLSVTVYDDLQALNYESANQTALVMVAFAFIAVSLLQLLQRRGGQP